MERCWQTYDAWIAHFDLLGFKEKIKTLPVCALEPEVDDAINFCHKESEEFNENIDSLFYADTFILYSKSDEFKHYPGILHVATHFFEKCIYAGIALRGAISFGEISVRADKRIAIGAGFLESHQYGEDQNWIGLILAPSASNKLKERGMDPARHRFVYVPIPRSGCSRLNEDGFAYSFSRGVANFNCPFVPKLQEMRKLSPERHRPKYDNTIKFVVEHWRKLHS